MQLHFVRVVDDTECTLCLKKPPTWSTRHTHVSSHSQLVTTPSHRTINSSHDFTVWQVDCVTSWLVPLGLRVGGQVTGQLADTPTRGLPTRGLDDSRTGHLAHWSTRRLDNSRTGQVVDWTTRGCHRRLCVLSFPVWRHLRDRELSSPRLVPSASWLVRELSSPLVDQSARCPVRELAIRELSSYRRPPGAQSAFIKWTMRTAVTAP